MMVDIDLLRPNSFNINIVSPENEEKLAESIRRLGLFKPIVVRETNDEDHPYEIIGGEHRWQAAKAAGLKQVPIFNLGDINDDKAKKISLADNARYGADDTIRLAEMLESMEEGANVKEFLPFTETDINNIFNSVSIALDELDDLTGYDEAPAPDEPKPERAPKTHTIMRFKVTLGDAEKITELISKIRKRQNFNASDDLTNAGDALVHQLFGAVED
jgi:hypothetical protein